jgi:hypothetical protein
MKPREGELAVDTGLSVESLGVVADAMVLIISRFVFERRGLYGPEKHPSSVTTSPYEE